MSERLPETEVEKAAYAIWDELKLYRQGLEWDDPEGVVQRTARAVLTSVNHVAEGYVKLPTNATEAEAMQKVGFAWLQQNQPWRLMK